MLVCSPDPGGVLVSVALVFKFPSADSKTTSWSHVNSVLRRRLEISSTFLNVDQSTIKLTGKWLRFVFIAWNLFLILCYFSIMSSTSLCKYMQFLFSSFPFSELWYGQAILP